MLSEHLRHTGNIKLFTETRLAMEAYDICYNKLTAQSHRISKVAARYCQLGWFKEATQKFAK